MTPTDLRAARHALGWSAARLADECGVSQSAVARWEAGSRRIPGPVVKLVAIWLKQHKRRATYGNIPGASQ